MQFSCEMMSNEMQRYVAFHTIRVWSETEFQHAYLPPQLTTLNQKTPLCTKRWINLVESHVMAAVNSSR